MGVLASCRDRCDVILLVSIILIGFATGLLTSVPSVITESVLRFLNVPISTVDTVNTVDIDSFQLPALTAAAIATSLIVIAGIIIARLPLAEFGFHYGNYYTTAFALLSCAMGIGMLIAEFARLVRRFVF